VSSGSSGLRLYSDAQGRFTAPVSTGTVYISFNEIYGITGLALPDLVGQFSASLTVTSNLTVDVTLPAEQVTVHVVDPSGTPVPGATVSMSGNQATVPSCVPAPYGVGTCSEGFSSASHDVNGNTPATTDVNGNVTLYTVAGPYDSASITPPPGLDFVAAGVSFNGSTTTLVNVTLQ
jgi:hypothetical protein